MAFKDNPEAQAPQSKTDEVNPNVVPLGTTAGQPVSAFVPGNAPGFLSGFTLAVPQYYTPTFQNELSAMINRYSKENDSNTPDWILAEYLIDCLETFNKTIAKREEWYGRKVFRYGSEPQNVEG